MNPDHIEPITELKRNAAGLIDRAAEARSPIVITQNGRATAVLQDVASFAEERRAFALLKLAVQGERHIEEGRSMSFAEFRKQMRARIRARTRRQR
jgi:prevent-host-death family protein